MPFTFSHPAIVLPLGWLSKRWFSLTALVMGSMMPDFEAFLWMKSEKDHSHTWLGILYFSLPVGLLLAFVFHNIIRNVLIDHMPRPLQQRLVAFKNFNWNQRFKQNWPVVLISILIGAASHFLWDSFSHFHGFFIKSIPALQNNIILLGYSLEIPFFIQYLNSVIGLVVLAWVIWRLPADREAKLNQAIGKYWLKVVVVMLGIYTIRLVTLDATTPDDLVIAGFASFLYSLCFTSWMSLKK